MSSESPEEENQEEERSAGSINAIKRFLGRNFWRFLLLGCLAVGGYFGWKYFAAERKERREVQVLELAEKEIRYVIAFSSNIEANTSADLAPKLSSRISEVLVQEGDKVSAGDVLVRLSDDDLDADIAARRASYRESMTRQKQLRKKVERYEGFAESKIVPAEQLRDLKDQLNLSNYETKRLRAQLRQRGEATEIVAPFDGIINKVLLDEGELSGPTSPAVELVDLSTRHVVAQVDERYLSFLDTKANVQVRAAVRDAQRYESKIIHVAPSVNTTTGAVEVHIALPEPLERMPLGTTLDVNLIVERGSKGIAVPRSAIVSEKSETSVRLVEKERIVSRNVTVDPWPSEKAYVTEGLSAGEFLVLDPSNVKVGKKATKILQSSPSKK